MRTEEMKQKASINTGACGDSQATSEKLYVVCWDLSTGFQFDVYYNGVQLFGLTEQQIDALMIINNCFVSEDSFDTRNLVAA